MIVRGTALSFPIPRNEDERLTHLQQLGILDSQPEPQFDAIVALACRLFKVPMALVSLVGRDDLTFKAAQGLSRCGPKREGAFCNYPVATGKVLIVSDAEEDPRFRHNYMVTGEPHIRFYAGAPISIEAGLVLGSFCIIDTKPRVMSGEDETSLVQMAAVVSALIEQFRQANRLAAFSSKLHLQSEQLEDYAHDLKLRADEEVHNRHQLTEANRLLRLAEEMTQSGHWRLELPSNRVTWSDQVFRIHGRDPATFTPTLESAIAQYHPDDHAEIVRLVNATVTEGRYFEHGLRIVRSDGAVRRVLSRGMCEFDEAGQVTAVFGVFMDVTETREAEVALAASEARYRILAETSSDVVTQLDLDLHRTYVSPTCRHLLGYEPDELVGMRPSATIHPEDVDAVRNMSTELAEGRRKGDRATATYRKKHKQGHWVWVEASLNLLRNQTTGAPLSIICSLRDVTDRQRTAHLLEEAARQAEQAARVKADFLANMSHELRTPLTGLIGVHDLLRADPSLSPEQRRLVKLGGDAGRSLLTVVNDVLDFSKIEAGQLAIEVVSFDADDLLGHCRDLARRMLDGKSIDVGLHCYPEPLGQLKADPTRISQVVLNFLTNAVKFTAQGEIRIAAYYDDIASTLRVEVVDSGIGLPTDAIDMLFERFTQADTSMARKFGGTGLGLAICKRLIELMQGTIGAHNKLDGGAVFWFEIPLQRSVDGGQEGPAAIAPAKGGAAHRILLAEDNALNAEIVSSMVSAQGHTVTHVVDGIAALEAFRQEAFDIVLMDVQMPVMDGYAATQAMRQHEAITGRSPTPIIGLTANATREDRVLCEQAGMNGHIAKPVEWAKLFDTIDWLTAAPGLGNASLQEGRTDADNLTLDERTLDELTEALGPDAIYRMVTKFVSELESKLSELEQMAPQELGNYAHTCVSMAGHFGLMNLSQTCAQIEAEVHSGTSPNSIALRRVGTKAIERIRRYLGTRAAA